MDLKLNQIVMAWLNCAGYMPFKKIERLMEHYGSCEDIWNNLNQESVNILKTETINHLLRIRDSFPENLYKLLDKEKADIVTCFDGNYPKKLKNIDSPPYILYYKGDLGCADKLSIAVVGSRKATSYGKWTAEKLTRELSELGVVIISGLAAGIDAVAHKTAIKNNSKTIGVIGCGIDTVYPKSNESLYKKIIDGSGVILSEFYFNTKPMPANFPVRNRIISGLSDGVLVIEAQEKSGTLITAGHAANQGKEIFAVPGNIDSLFSKGTNSLIKDGAKLVGGVDDIIEEITELKNKISYNNRKRSYTINSFSKDETSVINLLYTGEKSLYELEENIKMNIGDLLSTLTILEMKGIIRQSEGGKFIMINY